MEFSRHVSFLSTGIKFHLSSYTPSSSSRKRVSSTILSPSGNSSSFRVTMGFIRLTFGFMCLIMGDSLSSVWTSSSASLTLLSVQPLPCLQRDMRSVLHCSHCHHVDFVLDFIYQAIDIYGKIFIIFLPLSNPDVQFVELLCLLFHSHSFLPQVLQLPK
jgi:hypothetical protein